MNNTFELMVMESIIEGIGTTLASAGLVLTMMGQPNTLGGRLNNPGNIRHNSATKWEGAIGNQSGFVKFVSQEWGARALMKILKTYQTKYHLNTINDIITKYAPPNENDTASYIRFVSQKMGVRPQDKIDLSNPNTLGNLTKIIIKKETGYDCPQEVIYKALLLQNQSYNPSKSVISK